MAAPPPNPFRAYPAKRGPVVIFLYGDPGTQKTRRAMALPKPLAIIDMEGGASDYQDLGDPSQDLYLATRSVSALESALDWLEANPGKVATVIVDPITVVWQQLQQGHIARVLKRGKQKVGGNEVVVTEPEQVTFQVADWGKLKTHHGALLTRLMNLPCNVVLIARGGDKTNEKGDVVGYGWDGEKSLAFLAKVVIETRKGGDTVVKDRTGHYKDGAKVGGRVSLSSLLDGADRAAGVKLEREDEAAHRDAGKDAGNAARTPPDPAAVSGEVRRDPIVEGVHLELRSLYVELATEAGATWDGAAGWLAVEKALLGGKAVYDLPKAKAEESAAKLRQRTDKTRAWARDTLSKAGVMPAKAA